MLLLEIKKNQGYLGTLHFIGIGGIGMSGIAEIMHNLGYAVQGSDCQENANVQRLRGFGIKIFIGHTSENVIGSSYVITSTAIKPENVEFIAAQEQNIPIISRAQMLAELMRLKCSIAISGSHGKTTTTSLVACLFEAAQLSPTVINGGIINNRLTNAYLGKGDYLIVEADESDATFIKIPASIGVVTNIDPEHMDYYQDFASLMQAFSDFITNLPFYGFAVACIDHPRVRQLVETICSKRIITYGIEAVDANIKAYNITSNVYNSIFDVTINLPGVNGQIVIEQITIPIPGKHNVLNALAAIAIGVELNFGFKIIKEGFKNFQGVKRRFTKLAEFQGADIIDDYAHHPVEVAATLSTARNIANQRQGRVIAIFQPHRYSRLEHLFDDFTKCFQEADIIYLTPVYSAGEASLSKDSTDLAAAIASNSKQVKTIRLSEIETILRQEAAKGDIWVMMGAGDISVHANNVASKLLRHGKD